MDGRKLVTTSGDITHHWPRSRGVETSLGRGTSFMECRRIEPSENPSRGGSIYTWRGGCIRRFGIQRWRIWKCNVKISSYFSLITSPVKFPPRVMQEIKMMDVLFDLVVPSLRELGKIGDRYRFCMCFSVVSCI
jgi:hypothetical protein